MRAVVLCGHGGPDDGATGNGIVEAEWVRRLAYKHAELYPDSAHLIDRAGNFTQRGKWTKPLADQYGRVLVLDLHVNSWTDPTHRGVRAFYDQAQPHLQDAAQAYVNAVPAAFRPVGRRATGLEGAAREGWSRVVNVMQYHLGHADVLLLESFYCSVPVEAAVASTDEAVEQCAHALERVLETWKKN